MGKDSKPKDAGAKGKQAGGGSDENASKGKGKSGKASYGLGTCTYVKGKVNEACQKLQDGWLSNGDKVPPAEFAKLASEYSECPSGKKGGDLGWFPRGKMVGPFQDVAFSTEIGATSEPFKSTGRGQLRSYTAEELCHVPCNFLQDKRRHYQLYFT
uniref:Peptidyl-prolyl cis-trans isomerase n=1 Tax=Populus alba TaxID=43335 RepID=A0A4U5MWX2_POPAL|nr:hypothetical protein D5086_0000294430 [Populus alba]